MVSEFTACYPDDLQKYLAHARAVRYQALFVIPPREPEDEATTIDVHVLTKIGFQGIIEKSILCVFW